MKYVFLVLAFLIAFLSLATSSFAFETSGACGDRYITLINPVRGRNLWFDHSLKPLRDQYTQVQKNNFKATWLIQHDVLSDKELVREIKNFNNDQEIGVFLEVSKKYADSAKVIYPYDKPWFSPGAVFLSAYSQSERRKLIDKLFSDFKKELGFYPKSVGAWWIDSYSLDYLHSKYKITSAMIVADQLTTDSYGIWGQWWGVPYYPSKLNPLVPATDKQSKLSVVIVQWAQRDPKLAYGAGPLISNYSLQANDYIRQGKDTDYFKEVSDAYLNCQNKIGQITVGLETGIESVGYIDEYASQLKYLKSSNIASSVTMREFADNYALVFSNTTENYKIDYQDSHWNLTTEFRENKKLNDFISYKDKPSFQDTYLAEKSDFLDRNLNNLKSRENKFYFPLWVIFALICVTYFIFKRKNLIASGSIFIFTLTSFGLIFRSFGEYGYNIYFGPKVPYLMYSQLILIALAFAAAYFISSKKILQKNNLFWIVLPLSYGIDFLISILRYTYLSGKYYFGISLDTFHFLGIRVSKVMDISIINQQFEAYQAAALLRFDFNKIWDNLILVIIVYPLLHIALALILYKILEKIPVKIRRLLLILLTAFFILWIIRVLQSDPHLIG